MVFEMIKDACSGRRAVLAAIAVIGSDRRIVLPTNSDCGHKPHLQLHVQLYHHVYISSRKASDANERHL